MFDLISRALKALARRPGPQRQISASTLADAQLRLITDGVPIHVSYIDRNFRYRFVNNAYEPTYGKPIHKIIGSHASEILGKESFAEAKPDFERALAGETVEVERKVTGTPHGTLYFSGNYVPDIGPDGSINGFLVIVQDVTEKRRADLELERARIAMDRMGDGVRWIDLDGRVVYTNHASCEQLGYTREELLQLSIPDINPDFLAEEWPAYIEKLRRAGVLRIESLNRAKDGRVFPVDVTANLLNLGGQELIFAYVRDITARKQADEALRRGEEQLRLITDSVPVIIAYIDRDERFTYVNHGYEKLFGRPKSEFVGLTVRELIGDEAYETSRPYLLRALAGEAVTFERTVKGSPSGDRLVRVTDIPDHADDGTVRGLFVMVEDLTDDMAREKALRDSEAQFRAIFEEAGMGISLVDAKGEYIAVNPAYERMMGYDIADLRGRTYLDITHPDDRDESVRLNAELDQGRIDGFTLDKRYIRKDGKVIWVRLKISLIHDSEGRPVYKLAMIEDITERKHADERWKAILEHSPINIFVKDVEGRYLLCNRQFEQYHGFTSADIEGKTAAEVFPGELAKRFMAHDREVLASGLPSRIESQEDVAIGKRTFLTVKFPIKDEQGTPTAIVGMETDITERVVAEGKLKNSEAWLRLITDSIPAHIAYINRNLRYEFANEGTQRLFGRTREEMIGASLADVLDPVTFEGVRHDIEVALAGETVPFTRVVRSANGDPRHLMGSFVPHIGESGEADGVFVLTQDVTDLREAEERLRENEAQLRLITDTVPAFISRVTSDLKYAFVNKAYEDLFGRSREELIGSAMTDILSKAGFDEIRSHIDEVFLGKTVTLERKLPHSKLGERTIRSTLVPDKTADGHVSGFFVFGQDTTEARQAEKAIRASKERANEARMRLLDAIESLSAGFALFDSDDRLIICNDRYRQTYPAVAPILVPGVSFIELVELYASSREDCRNDPERVRDFIEQRVRRHEHPAGSFEMKLSDGRWVRVSERRTSDGGIVVVHSDITDSKSKEQLLQTAKEQADLANRTKTEFLANMSHELRTPLNAIIGFSEIIENQMYGAVGTKYLEYTTDIRQSAVHLLDVINDILDIAKVEAGKVDVDEGLVNLADVVETCHRIVGPRAVENQVRLVREVDPDLPRMRGDRRRIMQVLLNLLSNAVKFTPSGGSVTTRVAYEKDGGMLLSVTDTGVGIAPKDLEHVLEPFYQSDSTLSRRHEGTGLGLTLCKAFVELHGGRFELTSTLGAGTSAVAHFPASRAVYGTAEARRAS